MRNGIFDACSDLYEIPQGLTAAEQVASGYHDCRVNVMHIDAPFGFFFYLLLSTPYPHVLYGS
jgi:hypothetical protein